MKPLAAALATLLLAAPAAQAQYQTETLPQQPPPSQRPEVAPPDYTGTSTREQTANMPEAQHPRRHPGTLLRYKGTFDSAPTVEGDLNPQSPVAGPSTRSPNR